MPYALRLLLCQMRTRKPKFPPCHEAVALPKEIVK